MAPPLNGNGSTVTTVRKFLIQVVREAAQVTLALYKVLIPIVLLVKVLQELGVVDYLAAALVPVMGWVGLPGATGLVWATAMVTNLYGGIAVMASLAPELPLTVAQVTVLTGMMLIAHALPVELRIAQAVGARLPAMLVLRVGGALLFGFLFHQIYQAGDWLQDANQLAWQPAEVDATWLGWLLNELYGLVLIALIVTTLIFLLRLLDRLGVTSVLQALLTPVLRRLGIGAEASTITVVGITLGISYGGGLLINEARSGRVPRRDAVAALALLGLSHSLIEDTLLMMLLGGHLSGILLGRVAITVVLIGLMVYLIRNRSDEQLERWLMVPKKEQAAERSRA